MRTRSIFERGKSGRYVRPVPLSRNMGSLTSWNPLGPLRTCNGTDLPFSHALIQVTLLLSETADVTFRCIWFCLKSQHISLRYACVIKVLSSLFRQRNCLSSSRTCAHFPHLQNNLIFFFRILIKILYKGRKILVIVFFIKTDVATVRTS